MRSENKSKMKTKKIEVIDKIERDKFRRTCI